MRAKVTRVQVTSPLTRGTIDSSCKYDFSCGKSRKRRRKEKKEKKRKKYETTYTHMQVERETV